MQIRVMKRFESLLRVTGQREAHYLWETVTRPDQIEAKANVMSDCSPITNDYTYNHWFRKYDGTMSAVTSNSVMYGGARLVQGKPLEQGHES